MGTMMVIVRYNSNDGHRSMDAIIIMTIVMGTVVTMTIALGAIAYMTIVTCTMVTMAIALWGNNHYDHRRWHSGHDDHRSERSGHYDHRHGYNGMPPMVQWPWVEWYYNDGQRSVGAMITITIHHRHWMAQ